MSLIVCALLFMAPSPAHAYLDPGTGNILVYVFVSLLGTVVYSFKELFWVLRKGRRLENVECLDHADISIFSEGKNYWGTFKPIVNALIEKRRPFRYYSMDVDDPGLTVENDLMFSKYVGEGSAAFARLAQVRSRVMLATTPNIGTPGFPMLRPPYVDCLVHVCHAVDDIALYHKGSLDHYDAVFLVGDFQIPSIRHLEKLRGLREKKLYPAGLPYLDELAAEASGRPHSATDGKTVLVAPTWGAKGCLAVAGSAFIKKIADAGFHVVLRPHPHSWKVESTLLERIRKELKEYSNVEWDTETRGIAAMERADVLISEASGIRMDFALLYERPVITIKTSIPNPEMLEISDLTEVWTEKAERLIGMVVSEGELENIAEIVKSVLKDKGKAQLAAFREANVLNWGRSGEAIADYLIQFAAGEEEPV